MRIIDQKRYLALNFVDQSNNESTLAYHRSEQEAVSAWAAHTRISPVWPLISDTAKAEDHPDELPENGFVFFAGPINPEDLDVQFGPNFNEAFPHSAVWCSLGVLNLVVATTSDEENDQLRGFLKDLKVVCEIWTLDDGEIVECDIPQPINQTPVPTSCLEQVRGKTDFSVVAAKELEMAATALTASRRGAVYFPWIHEEVDGVVKAYGDIVQEYMNDEGKVEINDESELVYALANINSGLCPSSGLLGPVAA